MTPSTGGPPGSSVASQTTPAGLVTVAKLGRGVGVGVALGVAALGVAAIAVADGVAGAVLATEQVVRLTVMRHASAGRRRGDIRLIERQRR
jgi:hypothetical protein